jgi:hypothetical protein
MQYLVSDLRLAETATDARSFFFFSFYLFTSLSWVYDRRRAR